MPVLSFCSRVAWLLLVIGLSLLCVWVSKGYSGLVSGGSPLGRILVAWSMHSHYPMSKEVLVYYYNTVWPMSVLDRGERWPMDGSLDCCTIMQLEPYCQ